MSKLNGKWINKDSDHLQHVGDNLAILFSDNSSADSNKIWSSSKIDTVSGTLQTGINGKSNTGHTHDDRYYTESEVDALTWTESDITDLNKYTMAEVDTISGSINTNLEAHTSDVGKHREIDDNGTGNTDLWSADKIAYEITTATGIPTNHGALNGLDEDDHTQYSLVDGTRAFTGTIGGITPTTTEHLTTKGYVDGLVQGLDWQESVIDITSFGSATASGTNRYIASETSGGWTIHHVYGWNGDTWTDTTPNEGFASWVEDEDTLYTYNGSLWVKFGSTVTHENLNGVDTGTYRHLSAAQVTDLTDGGDCGIHTHDDIYYTETEINTWRADTTQTEMGHVHGVTSDIQTQLDDRYTKAEVNTISGTLQDNIDAISTHTDEIEYFTTTSGNITDKYVTLAHTPTSATEVALDVVGGCTQYYDEDYTVAGSNVDWNGKGLDGVIEIGDKLRVIYSY